MSSVTNRPSWRAAEAAEVIAILRGGRDPCRGALIMVAGDPPAPVWANAAAAALFGFDPPGGPTLDGSLGRALGGLDFGSGERFERLRIMHGFRARRVAAGFRRLVLASGRPVDVVLVADAEPVGSWDVSVLPSDEPAPEPRRAAVAASPEGPVIPERLGGEAAPWTAGRVLWWTDAADRVLRVEADASLIGCSPESLVGQALPGFFAARGCDPDRALARAVAGRGTWSGLRLTWPVDRDGVAPEVVLGAVPVWTAAREFEGYRGFGTLDPTRLRAAVAVPASPDAAMTEDSPILSAEVGTVDRAAADEPRGAPEPDAPDRPSERNEHAGGPPPLLVSGPYSSKVVVLRPFQTMAPLSGAAVLSNVGRLSPDERSAFEEIGLALGRSAPADTEPRTAEGVGSDALVAALPVPVWIEGEKTPARANRAFLDLTGYASADDLAARGGLAHLLGGADLPGAADGTERSFSVLDAHGRALAVEGRAGTEDGVSVLAIRRAEPGGDAMAEAAEDGLVLLDADGTVRRANRAAEQLLGRPRAELAGTGLPDLLAAESRGEAAAFVADLATRESAAPAILRLRRPDGTSSRLRATGQRLAPGLFGVSLRDAAAADRLDQALAEVSRLKAGKADFLAKLSHDLRTPLNGILGFAEVILDERFGPVGTPRYRDYLLDIHQSGTHVLALLSDMLDLSRMETGRLETSIAPVDVNRVVAESVAQMQADAHRERVIMRTSLPPRLPPALVDEDALRQMLGHVLSNAVRFNEPGGQVIVSTALGEAGTVAVRVRDTGVGMSDAAVVAATDPLRQGTADEARTGGGAGLGLPLTRALADANGASVTIKSRKDEGTLVELVLRAEAGRPARVPAA